MKVRNMLSSNYREVPNQFIIEDGHKEIFQSYQSVIAIKEGGTVTLDEKYWDYSSTTGKYRNIFLNEKKSETIKKINNGTYKLANLN